MQTGTVVTVRTDRGFGFIHSPSQAADVILSRLRPDGGLEFDEQLIERRVQFVLTTSSKGHRAREIQPAE